MQVRQTVSGEIIIKLNWNKWTSSLWNRCIYGDWKDDELTIKIQMQVRKTVSGEINIKLNWNRWISSLIETEEYEDFETDEYEDLETE